MTYNLAPLLIRNTFNIFGLSYSSSLDELRKRLGQLLQLREIQEFDTDIGPVSQFRNETEIRSAFERISHPEERLREVFFWFEDPTIESKKGITLIQQGDYRGAFDYFKTENQGKTDWIGSKNLALALLFDAFSFDNIESFSRSLGLWKHITESIDFWKFYEKHYIHHDELGTSSFLFQDFRASICEIISERTVAFYKQTKDPKAISTYYSSFEKIGMSLENEVLQPMIFDIKQEIEKLEVTSKIDSTAIKQSVEKINKLFIDLDKLKLSNYNPFIILKNNSAEKLRCMAIETYDLNSNFEIANLLLDQASKIAVSKEIVENIEDDKRQLQENVVWDSLSEDYNEIETLIADCKIEKAMKVYLKLDEALAYKTDIPSKNTRVLLLLNTSLLLMNKGHKLFDSRKFGIESLVFNGILNKKNHKNAALACKQATEILQERLHLLTFTDSINDRDALTKKLNLISKDLENCELVSYLDYYPTTYETMEETAGEQLNEDTQTAIKLLGSALFFNIFYYRFNEFLQKQIWKWIGWGSVIILCIIAKIYFKNLEHDPKNSRETSTFPLGERNL